MSVAYSVAVSQDVAFVQSDKPCSRDAQLNEGWSCFRAQGDQYHGTPIGSRLPSGPASGPTRLLVGVELPLDLVTLGARLGWAFRGIAPASDGQEHSIPFSGELGARVRLLSSGPFRLEVLAMIGARQLDAYAKVKVNEDRSVPPSIYQLDNPDAQTLAAYKRLGTGYVGAGLGASFLLTRGAALRFELPLSYNFPSTGLALSPTIGLSVTP